MTQTVQSFELCHWKLHAGLTSQSNVPTLRLSRANAINKRIGKLPYSWRSMQVSLHIFCFHSVSLRLIKSSSNDLPRLHWQIVQTMCRFILCIPRLVQSKSKMTINSRCYMQNPVDCVYVLLFLYFINSICMQPTPKFAVRFLSFPFHFI